MLKSLKGHMAEREGFEPSVEVSPHTRLAGDPAFSQEYEIAMNFRGYCQKRGTFWRENLDKKQKSPTLKSHAKRRHIFTWYNLSWWLHLTAPCGFGFQSFRRISSLRNRSPRP